MEKVASEIKNQVERLNNRLNTAKERINRLENSFEEIYRMPSRKCTKEELG